MCGAGQLYKVNVPVVVTQTAAGQQAAAKQTHKISMWKEAAAAPLAGVSSCPRQRQEGEPSSLPAPSLTQAAKPAQSNSSLASSQESALAVPAAEAPRLHEEPSPGQQVALDQIGPSSHPATVSPGASNSPCSQLLDFQFGAEEPSTKTEQLKSSSIDDILKRVIEEEREKAERARAAEADSQSDDVLRVISILGEGRSPYILPGCTRVNNCVFED